MTDSMKFGPGWLRNMSSEPTGSSNVYIVSSGGQNSTPLGQNINASSAASRNLFPEYRYGREEMLSLFDRNCLLPQILPSFKKLFIEKVQYPLALTPSSDEDNISSGGNNSRPGWLQRSSGGFGTASRGNGRGGTVDRGRTRGKSSYHSIYQRPGVTYDECLTPLHTKAERNWCDRNGTGESVMGNSAGGLGSLDWSITPSSSPRKEFSSHRNMENWRRTRQEDGSGDGPSTSGSLSGSDITGWRSSAGVTAFSGSHRWGRSTSWRDEDSNVESSNNPQRSISTVGSVGVDRGNGKASLNGPCGIGTVGCTVTSYPRVSSKNTPLWSPNITNADVDDTLPEWAMENPSELGGTFDASGAFHGDTDKPKGQNRKNETSTKNLCLYDESLPKIVDQTDRDNKNENKAECLKIEQGFKVSKSPDNTKKSKETQGDMSDRIKEVAIQVEKLIMEDDQCQITEDQIKNQTDCGRLVENMPSLVEVELNMKSNSVSDNENCQQQQPTISMKIVNTNSEISNQPHHQSSFSDHLPLQHHHLHHQQHMPVVPSHMINSNLNELWFYRDPQANVQGPFSAVEMTEWYRAGYFNENLFVRRFTDNRFRPLGDLIDVCHGNMPFTHSHLLPTSLELESYSVGPISNALREAIPLNGSKPSHSPISLSIVEQQMAQRRDDQLKENVTAAADSLSAALKGNSIGNNMNVSHMLTSRFQILQDQYFQHQEYQILAELSKNEFFQHYSAAERESIVRQKVQMVVLPEYLRSLNGLNSSLSILNPIAATQLNQAVAEKAKKDQENLFVNSSNQPPSMVNQLDANSFIMNAQLMQHTSQQLGVASTSDDHVIKSTSLSDISKLDEISRNELDLLNEYNLRMLLRGQPQHHEILSNESHNDNGDMEKPQILEPQNLMVPIWQSPSKQQDNNQHWSEISNAKPLFWEENILEQERSHQLQTLTQKQPNSYPKPLNSEMEDKCQTRLDNVLKLSSLREIVPSTRKLREPPSQNLDLVTNMNETQIKESHPEQQFKNQVNNKHPLSERRQQTQQAEVKPNNEERRREITEEKRRLKEERKRLQLEEDKRRSIIEEEKKARQIHEEKERQQQIQAQRRKALLGNDQATNRIAGTGTFSTQINKNMNSKTGGELTPSRAPVISVAPWSLSSSNSNSTAPGLAEIQKAERRERRADQQRHQEQLEKQMRENAAAAAEANDALLKWQAAPTSAPVMSLAKIQAEEAKRISIDNDQQRRRENDQPHHSPVPSIVGASGLSNIWGSSNRAWSANCTSPIPLATSGLWDEHKASLTNETSLHGSRTSSSCTVSMASAISSSTKNNVQTQSKTINAVSSLRKLRKSQTLPVINNTEKMCRALPGSEKNKSKISQIRVNQKVAASGFDDKDKDKKSNSKNCLGPQSSTDHKSTKVNEYENQFTNWCIKSLDNMSSKVDVPTFVTFLQDLEAPYEVKDYIRMYLGEAKESSEFARQFLERRSKYKSLQRAQNAHNDDMCKPAPAITPSANDSIDNKNKQKKIKKNKMTKMDARILGFSVTAAEGRINVGSRDYADGP
ncbi:hypothetical protein KR074_003059 [Drosophila pseudoananassae]|nr:hypothetical protein KR074_003059 [Drosophila pseudoananassae]